MAAIRRFFRGEDGSATVELVLVFPIFLMIVALIVDASMIFFRQSQVFRIVQDANRSLSIGRFSSPEETRAFILSAVAPIAPDATVAATVTEGIVVTTVSLPLDEIQITGLLSAFRDAELDVVASHVLER